MKNTLKKNIIAVSISNILVKIVSALVGILIARFLGVTKMGYYATAVNFSGLVGVLANSGLKDILIKKIAIGKEDTSSFLGTSALIQFVLSGLIFLIMIAIAHISEFEPIVLKLIYVAGLAGFFYELIEFLFSYYYGKEKMEKITVIRFWSSGLTVTFIFAALYLQADLMGIAWARLLVTGIIMIAMLYLIFRETSFTIDKSKIMSLLKEGLPFGLNTVFYVAYFRVGIVILSYYVTADELGLFDAAFKIMTLLYVIPGILSTALYPMLFRLGASEKGHTEVIQKLLKYMCLICFPMCVFIFIYSEQVIILVYGKEFIKAGEYLRILSPLLALQCINYPLADALTTKNYQHVRTRVIGYILILTVFLNFILITYSGAYGAAISTIAIEILLVLIFNFSVNKLLYPTKLFKVLSSVLACSGILFLILYFLSSVTMNIFIGIPVAVFSYLALTLLFRVFEE